MSSRYVWYRGKILPRIFVEPPDELPPGVCRACGGTGEVAGTIDEERLDEMVACSECQMYCRECGEWALKEGHRCRTR